MSDLAELRDRIAGLAAGYPRPRQVGGMMVFSTTRTTFPLGYVAEPTVSLVAQGAKRSTLGDQAFDYGAGQFLVITVDLPLTSNVCAASEASPFIACSLRLDPPTIAQLLLESRLPAGEVAGGPAISVSDAPADLIDAFVRLLKLASSPDDARVLAPAVRREIHWRLLTGPQGGLVRQVGLADSGITLAARAIAWIKDHYHEVIRAEDLAAEVGLSVSSLNRHFRAATAMSPVQYQKLIRLQQARIRLLANPRDVAGAGHAVGYTSASQFTREYRRQFGAPPGQDAAHLQDSHLVVE
ncbi:MAG TPA: AraC family transcriptional regulator [Trebonia sp.]|nr:AraC family transcriptional regulator [Trebonia sp.]